MLAPLFNPFLPHLSSGMLRQLFRVQKVWHSIRTPSGNLPWPLAIAQEQGLFFVQIGANYAEINDPILRQIILHGWQGVLVEPQLEALNHLQQTLRHFPGLYFENTALAERPGEKDFFFIEKTSNSPTWVNQVSSLKEEVTSKVAENLPGATVNKKSIPCTTLNLLLEKYQIKKLDVLLIDTEGYEAKILNSFDLDRYRPRLIYYEHFHLSAEERILTEQRLQKYGYRTSESGYDTLAQLEPA